MRTGPAPPDGVPAAGGRAPRVLVTDARRGSSLAFIRSLGRRGWFVAAASDESFVPGFRSRYVDARVVHPDAAADPAGAGRALADAAQRLAIELVVPITDETIIALRSAPRGLPAHCRVAMPAPEAQAVANDKAATLELARSLGVPVPVSRAVTGVDAALAAATGMQFPIVVKPASSRVIEGGRVLRRSVAYARDARDLADRVRELGGGVVLLQEFYPGVGEGVELLLEAGVPIAAFQHRRLREVPTTGGASSFREGVPLDPVMLDASVRILAALRWTGLAMVEFRVGADGPRLMEVNGRVWGSLPLAVRSGVDFPALLAALYLGEAPLADRGLGCYPVGRRARNLELDVIWIASVLLRGRGSSPVPHPARTEALGALLQLIDPRTPDDILSRSDPLPGLVEVARIVRKVAAKVGSASRAT